MIKLRVEWHRSCPKCGTELVSDFFENAGEQSLCPWCGAVVAKSMGCADVGLKDYVENAIKDIEDQANSRASAT